MLFQFCSSARAEARGSGIVTVHKNRKCSNGFAAMPLVGVVLKVVTSTGRTLDKLFHRFLLTPITPIIALEPAAIDHTMAAL